jgi:hypothetical protein
MFPRGKRPKVGDVASAPASPHGLPVQSTPTSVSSKLPRFNEYGSNLTCSPTFGAKLAAAASLVSQASTLLSKGPISLVSVSLREEGD